MNMDFSDGIRQTAVRVRSGGRLGMIGQGARLLLVASVLMTTGCEVEELYVGGSSSGVSFYFRGNWNGVEATGQSGAALYLEETDRTVHGTWHGPSGVRSVSGTSDGHSLVLYVQGGDVWYLRASGGDLTGTGHRPGGGEYPLRFTRR